MMVRQSRWAAVMAVVTLLVGAGFLSADDKKSDTGPLDARTFVARAASGGQFEIKSSQLAQEHALRPEVKQFAEMMIRDHTRANRELMALAQKKQLTVPTAMDTKCQEAFGRLANARGEVFDAEYVKAQVQAHREAVKLFEQASRSLDDPELKGWATETLPKLREHRKQVEALAGGTSPDKP